MTHWYEQPGTAVKPRAGLWHEATNELTPQAKRLGAVQAVANSVEAYGLEETLRALYAVTGLKVNTTEGES